VSVDLLSGFAQLDDELVSHATYASVVDDTQHPAGLQHSFHLGKKVRFCLRIRIAVKLVVFQCDDSAEPLRWRQRTRVVDAPQTCSRNPVPSRTDDPQRPKQ